MNKRILVTDKVHQLLINGLNKLGFEVIYQAKMPYEEVKLVTKDYGGIIINSKVICDEAFLSANQHLNFIGRLGSGLDIIDLPKAEELSIKVINSPEGNANAVAEHAMGMLLSLSNNITTANSQVKQFIWDREPNRGFELAGKTIGIIGFGHTGRQIAKKLKNWEVNIVAYDKYLEAFPEEFGFVKSLDLTDLLKSSDIVSIHLPLTKETRGWVNRDMFSICKKGGVIINTSRGPILDTKDLADYLENGHLSGACIDVLENEKFDNLTESQKESYQRLFDHHNTILTPHVAGWTHESLVKIAEYLLLKIAKFYQL